MKAVCPQLRKEKKAASTRNWQLRNKQRIKENKARWILRLKYEYPIKYEDYIRRRKEYHRKSYLKNRDKQKERRKQLDLQNADCLVLKRRERYLNERILVLKKLLNHREKLSDSYCISRLKRGGYYMIDFPDELIEAKRQQIRLIRATK